MDGQELYDPLSQNLFRLLGYTRDVEVDLSRAASLEHIDFEGLKVRRFVDDRVALIDLLGQSDEFHQAYYTWFDGRTASDREALAALSRREPSRARRIWQEIDEPHSQHNLAVLDYILLLRNPESDIAWKSVLATWSDLAGRTNVDVYAKTVDILCDSLEQAARTASRLQRPEVILRCLHLLESAYSEEQLGTLQTLLLETDARKLELACAEVRYTLADFSMDTLVMETAQNQFEYRVRPIAEFLLSAALPNSAFGQQVRQEVSLVLRAMARGWGEMNEVARQRTCLQGAASFSRSDDLVAMQDELRRLEEAKGQETVMLTAPAQVESVRTNWTALLGLGLLALVVVCFFMTPTPLKAPTKTALEKRLQIVLKENDAVLRELKCKPSVERARELRQRNEQLRAEMSSLEKALKSR
jgi:hypothetical protein